MLSFNEDQVREKAKQAKDQVRNWLRQNKLNPPVWGLCQAAPLVLAMQSTVCWVLALILFLSVTRALFSSFSFSS